MPGFLFVASVFFFFSLFSLLSSFLPGSGLRAPRSTEVDEEAQQEINREWRSEKLVKLRRMLVSREEMLMLMLMLMSREELLMKLEEKEKRLKESLSFAGRKAGDLTDSG